MSLIVRVVTRLNIGGPARYLAALALHLKGRWRSLLVAGVVEPEEGDMTGYVRGRGVIPVMIPTLSNRLGIFRDIASIIHLYRLFRRERPQIVELHLFKARLLGAIAARMARVPIVIEVFHGTRFAEYHRGILASIIVLVERWLSRLMNVVVAISESVAREITALRIAPSAKVRVVGLGLELQGLLADGASNGMLRDKLGLPPSALVVGTVARLVPIKAIGDLVRAAAQVIHTLPGAYFIVVGDGPERPSLERHTRTLGLAEHVRFLGWRSDLDRVYPEMDLFVLSSLNEGTPVALIEAMAAGRPVVATQVGGVPDVVTHGVSGLLVPSRNPAALAEAVITLLNDEDRRRQFGLAGRASVYPRFSIELQVQEMEQLYESLLADKP